MSKTLIIAEKPSVAGDIARALGVKKDGDHFESDRYVISSAVGHLVEIGEPDLYAGVLIGRSDSCLDRGLRAVLSGQISRLHLLLLAEQRRVYAIDLCSTNGTWYKEKRVRRILLPDEGLRLVLSGNDSKVELTWHPRAALEK